ncbi:hypothetical protein, partial [Glaesserella parasuis]|uniref:hypothetical protein n=1 Tax=Glaesserella parasuis TaxID=738 RepID=UPI003F38ACC0
CWYHPAPATRYAVQNVSLTDSDNLPLLQTAPGDVESQQTGLGYAARSHACFHGAGNGQWHQ